MNRFDWKWYLKDIDQDKPVKVFTTFSCGGGSSMGYKRAGFEVIGNVEIDPKMNAMYCRNHHPKYNYCMDLREFNKLDDLPDELIGIDILDGSPPCTTFSTAGLRDKTWGKTKKFREGQAEQTLDDLFFVFLDTVEKLRPKVVIAENVVGLITGKAKGYVNAIIHRFRELGYDVQIFKLNAAEMDVPQARERVFFIANNQQYPKLKLAFDHDVIKFKEVRSEKGLPITGNSDFARMMLEQATENDQKMEHVTKRLAGKTGAYYSQVIISDEMICKTVTSGGNFYRLSDRTLFTDEDFTNVQSFPQDYNYNGNNVQYVCGMSVPPNMMANIAEEVYEQWLKQ